MKRKILSVLSVLMAVLMSTAALSACNKTPAGADSSGGNGESISESSESGAQNENEPEKSFDYTGWQDFSYEMEATTCKIVPVEGKPTFGGTSPVYPATVNFRLPADFKILYDVYGDEFHAGTKFDGDQIVTNGGRVLGVTAKGKDLKEARANAYAATEWVKFDNKYMRHDIGKAIDEA